MSMHEHWTVHVHIEQRLDTLHIAWTLNRECTMHEHQTGHEHWTAHAHIVLYIAWTLNRECTGHEHGMKFEPRMHTLYCTLHEHWTVRRECTGHEQWWTLNSACTLAQCMTTDQRIHFAWPCIRTAGHDDHGCTEIWFDSIKNNDDCSSCINMIKLAAL